ncbi:MULTISPECIES: pyrroline-5-carboxylate reductase [unclassified Nitratiruptor]|uniref:pyrroline-5-carboxylate reductase n=1 Tax=unclassified Nitratiruptor TaxID=2624044 RepID=UPI001914FB78|nr:MULTISPECIES: pyrroline-5-carboxylate reductase [unclassified Nitratiruptor]BCD60658.1 pyrroline-5-carboxylate reductase [Nitratiruptor sp. YY08-10]BCD64589.1 pyrroline-5-carboxylate reductase [Nitratiruptor sp. YY08-14]
MVSIIGYGAMAKAILQGLLRHGIEVEVVGRDEEKLQKIQKEFHISVQSLQNYDITDKTIILAVKPYALKDVANQVKGKAELLISILAGISLNKLYKIPAQKYVRAMPNLAAIKQASITAITGDRDKRAIELIEKIGKVVWVENEKELDIATAIAGSGPAFLALAAEAMADGGVLCGLKRDIAYELVSGLFQSYAAISEKHPALIKDKVMSPAGTTAAGYKALEENGVRNGFMEAILQAFKRTQQ